MKKPMLEGLLERLKENEAIVTNWIQIANECSMEKQIEIRAELLRCIKRVEKELKSGN